MEVYPDGRAEIRTSSAEMGQNLVGVLAACTAEELGLPFDRVSVLVMDTDRTPDGGPTTASRQTYVSGNAARLAARTMREQMQAVLAEKFDVPPEVIAFHEGLAYVDEARLAQVRGANGAGGNGSGAHASQNGWRITFAEAVQAMLAEGRDARLRYEYWAPKTQPLGTGGDMHFAFSYAVHAALVSVDMETGEVAVEKVITAHDVGRAINPLSLAGQIEGGIVMGMGNALTEHYIEEDGVPGPSIWASTRCPASSSRRTCRTSLWSTPRRTDRMGPRASARSVPSPSARPSPMPSTTRWACARWPCPSTRTRCCSPCSATRANSMRAGETRPVQLS